MIDPFQLDQLGDIEFAALICGLRGTGKTTLVYDIIDHCNLKGMHVKVLTLNKQEYPHRADEVIECKDDVTGTVESIMDEQKNQALQSQIQKTTCKKLLLVLDDCMWSRSFVSSQILKQIVLNSRHYYTSVLITTQFMQGIPMFVRANLDYVFMYNTDLRSRQLLHRNTIYEYSFSVFEGICTAMKDYECLVINNRPMRPHLKHYTAGDMEAKRRTKERLCSYEEELMRVTWHPTRLEQCGEEMIW